MTDTTQCPKGKAEGYNEFLPPKPLPIPEIEDFERGGFGEGGLA
jgi:hypothetical protein